MYRFIHLHKHPCAPTHTYTHIPIVKTLRSSLSLFFFLFFFRTTQKFTVTERSDVGLFDPSSLESFPELAGYADSTLSRPLAGSPPGNRPKQRRGKREELTRGSGFVSNGRLTLQVILFANVQSLKNKVDELHARICTQRDVQDCSILCFCETWLGEGHPMRH